MGEMGGKAGSGGLYIDRKSTRLNSSHSQISYAVFCLKKKKKMNIRSQPCFAIEVNIEILLGKRYTVFITRPAFFLAVTVSSNASVTSWLESDCARADA